MAVNYRALHRAKREIRLLQVLGQGQDAKFKRLPNCRISHAELSETPRYVALSYTWGHVEYKRLILVEGSPVYITVNLYDALLALRQPEEDLIVWVDSLCINQEDNEEKSWQVGMMKDIYRQAAQVLAWLGPADKDSDHVLTFLNTLGREAEACGIEHAEGHHLDVWQNLMLLDPRLVTQGSSSLWARTADHNMELTPRRALIDLFHSTSGWHRRDSLFPVAGMRALLTRPWWGRVWVLQEIALPENAYFVCGTHRISRHRCRAALNTYIALWTVLMRNARSHVSSFTPYHFAITTSLFHHRPNIMLCARDIYQIDRFPLAALLQATCVGSINSRRHGPHHLESTDPRDKVFALLSLASDEGELKQRGIVPDYTSNCVDVYTSTMAALLEQGHISLLSLCQTPKIQQSLPSWVVDWSRSATDMLQDVRNDHITLYPTFTASDRSRSRPTVVVQRKAGIVEGIALDCALYDEVMAAGSFPCRGSSNEVPLAETYSWPRKWLIEIIRLTYYSGPSIDFRDRLAAATRTSIAGVGYNEDGMLTRLGDGRFSDAVTLLKGSLKLIRQRQIRLDAGKFLAGLASEEVGTSRTEPDGKLSSEINGKSLGRLPFVTTRGHLVLSSEHVRRGDVVALVRGSQVPFILRRQEGDTCNLISEAYVDGIMDGEAARVSKFQLVPLS